MTKFQQLNLAMLLGLILLGVVHVPFMQTSYAKGRGFIDPTMNRPVTAPLSNSHTVAVTTTVALSYSEAILPHTVTSRTLIVHAMQTGQITQTYSISGTLVQLIPRYPFKAGELVQVTATTQTLSYDEFAATAPTVWQFRTAVTPTTGLFGDSGQKLGSSRSYGLAVGDLDKDSDLDLFVGNFGQPNRIWINQGQGVFGDSGQSLGQSGTTSVRLGDVDGDGDLDAFTANWDDLNRIWVNNGQGFFADSGQALGSSYDGALGDVEGDGDLDLFTGERLWLNDGQGEFVDSGQTFIAETGRAVAVALGDIDHDGDLDVIVSDSSPQTTVWFNDGQGWFYQAEDSSPTDLAGSAMFHIDLTLGDVDNDGDLDLLATDTGNSRTQLWRNNGQGRFEVAQSFGNLSGTSSNLGDVDGDGDLDVLVSNPTPSIPPQAAVEGGVTVWLNDGRGSFSQSGQHLDDIVATDIALGDIDRDHDLDLVIANPTQANKVWFNDELPDLAIQQQTNLTIARPGDTVAYTIIVANRGPVAAAEVSLTATLPLHTQVVEVTDSAAVADFGDASGLTEIYWHNLKFNIETQQHFTFKLRIDNPLSPTIGSVDVGAAVGGRDPYGNSISAESLNSLPLQRDDRPFMLLDMAGPVSATLSSTVRYDFTLQHHPFSTSTLPISNVIIYQSLISNRLTVPISGDDNLDNLLDVDEVWQFQETYVLPDDTTSQTILNEAYALGYAATSPIPYSQHSFAVEYQPKLQLHFATTPVDGVSVSVGQPLMLNMHLAHADDSDGSLVSQLNLVNSLTGQVACDGPNRLEGGETLACQGSYLIQPTDVPPLVIEGVAEGVDRDGDLLTAHQTLTISHIEYQPQLSVTLLAPTRTVTVGSRIPYTVLVRHAANSDRSPMQNLSLTHTRQTPLTRLDDTDTDLDWGETWVYTTSYLVQPTDAAPQASQVVNQVTVTAADNNQDVVTGSDSVNVPLAAYIIPIENVVLTGPQMGLINQQLSFTGTVSPISVTLPLGFQWEGTEQFAIGSLVSQREASIRWEWSTPGPKTIWLTVSNAGNLMTTTHTITLAHPNRAPVITTMQIIPLNPNDEIDLALSYAYFDIDGDSEGASQIRWTAGGFEQPSLDDVTTIPAALTQVGQTWCAQLTPVDARGLPGEAVEDCTTILPGPLCQAETVEVTPLGVTNTAQDLTLTYALDCRIAQTPQVSIRWYRDGQLQPRLNDQVTVSADITLPFEGWQAEITPCFEGVCDAPLTSNTVYIAGKLNVPPQTTASITPIVPLAGESLQVSYTVTDEDGAFNPAATAQAEMETPSPRIRWYRDGTLYPLLNNQTVVTAARTVEGQTWCVTVQSSDGLAYGDPSELACVRIGSNSNRPPQALNPTLGGAVHSPNQPLMLAYSYRDVNNNSENVEGRIIRWYRNGSYQPGLWGQLSVPSDILLAGDVWSAELAVFDGRNHSLQVETPSVAIGGTGENQPPQVQHVRLTPNRPTSDNVIEVRYDYLDPDGDAEGDTQIHWYTDPRARVTEFDGLTRLPAEATQAGQIWYVRVTPHDGQAYGQTESSESVSVAAVSDSSRQGRQLNTPPQVAAIILPAEPTDEDALDLLFTYSDADNDQPETILIEWQVDGLAQPGLSGERDVPAMLTQLNQTWCAFVTPIDVRGGVGEQRSVCVEVVESDGRQENAPPAAANASIVQEPVARSEQNLDLAYDFFDADGDGEGQSRIRWYRFEVTTGITTIYTQSNNLKFVPARETSPGERWFATIEPYDGEDYGLLVQTDITVINRPPVITDVHIEPHEANTNLDLTVMYQFVDSDDYDDRSGFLSEFQWYINGEPLSDVEQTLPSSLTQVGQSVTVSVRPNDGYEFGQMVTTTAVVGAPRFDTVYIPLMLKSPPSPTATPSPTTTPSPTVSPTPTTPPSPTPGPCTPQRRYEPNNTRSEACDIQFDALLTGTYPDDDRDVYEFTLNIKSSIEVTVDEYQNFKDDPDVFVGVYSANSEELVDGRGARLEDVQTVLRIDERLEQGVYYILIFNNEVPFNNEQPYTLRVVRVE